MPGLHSDNAGNPDRDSEGVMGVHSCYNARNDSPRFAFRIQEHSMLARRLSAIRFLLSLAFLFVLAGLIHAADDPSIDRLRKDLTFLTSDECEGRGAQTHGLQIAADYIAAEFKRLGL